MNSVVGARVFCSFGLHACSIGRIEYLRHVSFHAAYGFCFVLFGARLVGRPNTGVWHVYEMDIEKHQMYESNQNNGPPNGNEMNYIQMRLD